VRQLIAQHANLSKKRMSGEEFLEHCDNIFGALLGGVSVAGIAALCQPVYARLGIKTGKVESRFVAKPIGTVLVALLCSFARSGQTLRKATRAHDGCILQAEIPSDVLSFAGKLVVTARHQAGGTLVEAAATIRGQLLDWGKSNRCLRSLFADISSMPAAA
jgi:hypothetical protein